MGKTAYKPMDAYEKQILEQQFGKVWASDEKMVRHCVKSTSNFFTSDEGIIVTFDRPNIKTSFWFGEHGYDYDEKNAMAYAASKSVEFFIGENMDNLRTYSAAWGEPKSGYESQYRYPYVKRGAYCNQPSDCALGQIVFGNCCGKSNYWRYDNEGGLEACGFRKLTDREIERLREAEERRDALFEKRLRTYLKRYGLSKVSCDTFWADR